MAVKIITTNRKARHDYHIVEVMEAGIVLQGTEVKALRDGRANLKESYAAIKNGELYLHGMHISPYDFGNLNNHEPTRSRKLLMHHREIKRLIGKTEERGMTLVPMKLYFSRGRAKVEIGLAKGKREYDRRQDIAKRDADREIKRALKHKNDFR